MFAFALGTLLVAVDDLPTDHRALRGAAFLLFATLVTALYAALYLRATSRVTPELPMYIREPPSDLPPALVGGLFETAWSSDKLAATVLDLARRGVVEMRRPGPLTSRDTRPGDDDRWLVLHRGKAVGLEPLEQEVVYELFDHIGKDDRVRVGDARAWWQEHPATAGYAEAVFSMRLRQAMVARGLLDGRALRMKQILTFYGAATFLGALLVGTFGIWALLSISLAGVFITWAQRLTDTTKRGVELKARYEAFRRYLADFGRFADMPAEAVVVWERYLPLAIVLGLGSKAEKVLRVGPQSLIVSVPGFSEGRSGRSFPDKREALAYVDFRRFYDPALPTMTVTLDDYPRLAFRPRVDTAMAVTGVFGKLTLRTARRRQLVAFLVVGPFILIPVIIVALVLAFAG